MEATADSLLDPLIEQARVVLQKPSAIVLIGHADAECGLIAAIKDNGAKPRVVHLLVDAPCDGCQHLNPDVHNQSHLNTSLLRWSRTHYILPEHRVFHRYFHSCGKH